MLRLQWSTFVFQMLNFFVLLVVLGRFFYRPLMATMRRRQEDVARRLADADERARRADAERARLAEVSRAARAQAEALLAGARAETARLKEAQAASLRQDTARRLEEARQRIAEEERAARRRLADEARRTAVKVAASLIDKVAGRAFHQALIDQVLETGLRLDGGQAELLSRGLEHAGGHVTVESAYPIGAALRPGLEEAVTKALGAGHEPTRVEFRVEPSLIAGLRVVVGVGVVDLSLRQTLAGLERGAATAEP